MKVKEVTRQWFAIKSFQYDRSMGNWRDERNSKGQRIKWWSDLDEDVQRMYLEEANYYLKMTPDNWPVDILKYLDDGKTYLS